MKKAKEVKERANQAFRDGKLDEALVLFNDAASFISRLNQYTAETQELRKTLL